MKVLIFFTIIGMIQANVLKHKNEKEFRKIAPRIVGGDEAGINQFPYQVAIYTDFGSFCGGAIIARKTILTAASCIEGATVVQVAFGLHRLNSVPPNLNLIAANEFNVVIDWDPWYKTNNLALIYLPNAITYTDAIKKIDIFEKTANLESITATISGWGKDSDSSNVISPVLRYTNATIISNTNCKKFFSPDVIKDTNLCLDGTNSKSVCNGDIGGPLTVQEEETTRLAGVASSFSSWGCSIGYPSVYTRISSYIDWIKLNIRET